MRKYWFIFTFIFLSVSVNAQHSFNKKELMNIGGQKVSVGEFMNVYNKNKGQDSTSINDYLKLYINFRLKVMEAEALRMDTAASFKRELAGYRKQLAKPYFVDNRVTDALVKEAYQREQKDVRASHILIRIAPTASPEDTLKAWNKINKIRNEVLHGKDFGKAAAEYSDDPSAHDQKGIPGRQRPHKGNHGDLGYFSVFNMVYPFESAAYHTAVGSISKPVRTRYGYHIIKVTDRRPAMGTAEVAHIFVALKLGASPADSLQKAQKIQNIYSKIEDGMSFEDAAIKFSEDKGSSGKGGKLPKFTSSRIVPEFVEHVDQLNPGQISKPFQTSYGFHIIKLLSRERPGTFEQESSKLNERVAKGQRAQKSKEVVLARIKKDHHLVIDTPARDELFSSIDSTAMKGVFVADSLKKMIKPVMSIGRKDAMIFTQYDLAKFIQKHQPPRKNISKQQFLQKMFRQFVDEHSLQYENSHLEEFYPEFNNVMKEYHDGILLFNLMDQKVWSKAIQDTIGLQNYYQSHQQKYQWGERVKAILFHTGKQWLSRFNELTRAYPDKVDLARAIRSHKIKNIPGIKADTGIFQKGEVAALDHVKWQKGLSAPVLSGTENLATIIYIEQVLPAAPKSFEEARGQVTADYQDYLEKQWLGQLRSKYPVQINQKSLKKLLKKQAKNK